MVIKELLPRYATRHWTTLKKSFSVVSRNYVMEMNCLGFRLLVGQINAFADVHNDSGKLWWTFFFAIFWHLIEQMINQENNWQTQTYLWHFCTAISWCLLADHSYNTDVSVMSWYGPVYKSGNLSVWLYPAWTPLKYVWIKGHIPVMSEVLLPSQD